MEIRAAVFKALAAITRMSQEADRDKPLTWLRLKDRELTATDGTMMITASVENELGEGDTNEKLIDPRDVAGQLVIDPYRVELSNAPTQQGEYPDVQKAVDRWIEKATGKRITVCVDPERLRLIAEMGIAAESELIFLEVTGENTPIIVSVKHRDWSAVLMPVQTRYRVDEGEEDEEL